MNINRLNQLLGHIASLKRYDMHNFMPKQRKVAQRVHDLISIGALQSFIGFDMKGATLDNWEKKIHEVIQFCLSIFVLLG